MSTPESGEEAKFLGSRTLHRVSKVLKADPSSLDPASTLLGSRRLAATAKAWKAPQKEYARKASKRRHRYRKTPELSEHHQANSTKKATVMDETVEMEKMESVEKTTEVGATVEECFA
eukprot:1564893-Rhodomonas_salina.5